jgi:RNA polymerase sigma factor (sigma-70 family)
VPLSAAFLRVRSDEQLVSLFRAGSDDAFRVIHDRYHARLLAYARQMLRGSSGDAEDAMQDVFVRAFKSLRASNRPVLLRAWLYRIAHNRCIDELRRPVPIPAALEIESRPAIASASADQDPAQLAERGEAMAQLIADVRKLPVAQRSALLMREMQGLSYQELAETLGVSVPAVKSLLLRARTGLLNLKVARETPCREVQLELVEASDRGVRMNARCRRHVRECAECRARHRDLRGLHRRLAALAPLGPLAKLTGLFSFGGGAGGGTIAGGSATGGGVAGGGAGVIGGVTAATAAKVAAVVATAAVIGTAGPAAIRAVSGPSRPAAPSAQLPADARQLTQTTGATVGPSSAAVDAGLASPPVSPDETAALQIPGDGATGASGMTGVSGVTGVSGDTGASGATGATAPGTGSTDATSPDAGSTDTTTPAVAPTETAATGPTASVASVPAGGSSGNTAGASGGGGTSGPGGASGP